MKYKKLIVGVVLGLLFSTTAVQAADVELTENAELKMVEGGNNIQEDSQSVAKGIPDSPYINAEPVSYNQVRISWNASDAQFYNVYRATSKNGKYALIGVYDYNNTTCISEKLGCGTTYYYKIRPWNRQNNGSKVFGAYSNIVSAKPSLSKPSDISAKPNTYNTVKIAWNKVDGANYYQVYRSTSPNGKYALLGTYDSNTTNSVSRQLGCGNTYYYKVRAYRWVGGKRVFSAYSNIASARPSLSKPSDISAKPNTYNTVKIAWNKVDGANYYQVYRSTGPNGKYALLGTYDSDTTNSVSRQLGCGNTYYYKVRAYRWVGGKRVFSPFSYVKSATPFLEKITGVQAEADSESTIKVSWNKIDGANYYQVYQGTSSDGEYALLGTYNSNTTSITSGALKAGNVYYYKVRGYRWVGGKRVFSYFSELASDVPYGPEEVLHEYAEKVYAEVGGDLKACFDWVVNNMTYERYYGHLIPPDGYTRCQWYATKAFENHKGNCYCYAGAFYYLAKYLGYDAEYVEGQVTKRSGGYTPHGWVEIDGKYICDPEGQAEISPSLNFYMMPKGNTLLEYIR